VARIDSRHFAITEYLDTAGFRGCFDGRRDRPHAADRMAPRPFDAVHLAERMVQKQVAGPRVIRAREVSDDRVESEAALQRIELEAAVEPIAGAAREQVP